MTEWNPALHPRNSAGRFVSVAETLAVHADELRPYAQVRAESRKRDEISAAVEPFDTEHPDVDGAHEFVAINADSDDPAEYGVCRICGDNEGGNDHQDPADHAHVWMDVENLTVADIDALDALTDILAGDRSGSTPAGAFDSTLAAAQMVADWIGGFDGETNRYVEERSALLADRDASLIGLRAFMDDVQADRMADVQAANALSPAALVEAANEAGALNLMQQASEADSDAEAEELIQRAIEADEE